MDDLFSKIKTLCGHSPENLHSGVSFEFKFKDQKECHALYRAAHQCTMPYLHVTEFRCTDDLVPIELVEKQVSQIPLPRDTQVGAKYTMHVESKATVEAIMSGHFVPKLSLSCVPLVYMEPGHTIEIKCEVRTRKGNPFSRIVQIPDKKMLIIDTKEPMTQEECLKFIRAS